MRPWLSSVAWLGVDDTVSWKYHRLNGSRFYFNRGRAGIIKKAWLRSLLCSLLECMAGVNSLNESPEWMA